MSSVLCNQPTPNGLCQRPVSAPGAHCGVAHTEAVSPLGPTPAPPAPSAPVDPFGNAPGGFDVRREMREIREIREWAEARRERDARYAKTKGQNQSPSPASDPLQQTFGESVEKRVTDAAPELGSATVASIATGSPVPVAGGAAGVAGRRGSRPARGWPEAPASATEGQEAKDRPDHRGCQQPRARRAGDGGKGIQEREAAGKSRGRS